MRLALLICGAWLSVGCANVVECDHAPMRDTPPLSLEETGLLCNDVVEYTPAFRLWSDGAHKRRFIQLPKDAVIDTSDMDHWSFPVGTRLWKELATDDEGVTETRFAERWGAGESEWTFATYLPDDTLGPAERCSACHGPLPERVLGFSAVQLATEGGRAVVDELADHFDAPPILDDQLTDDPVARNAAGLLHANCGGCHHDGDRAVASSMRLRLRASDRTLEDTGVYRTAVGVETDRFTEIPTRIVPGSAADSAVFQRLAARGVPAQMPPLGTETIDHSGAIAVGTWITALQPLPEAAP